MKLILFALALFLALLACVSCADQPSAPDPYAEGGTFRPVLRMAMPDT